MVLRMGTNFGCPVQAIDDYSRVLGLEPGHANAAYRRGACQNRMGNFQQAIEDYQMALEKDQEFTAQLSPVLRASAAEERHDRFSLYGIFFLLRTPSLGFSSRTWRSMGGLGAGPGSLGGGTSRPMSPSVPFSTDSFTSRYAQTRPLLIQLQKTGQITASGSRTPPRTYLLQNSSPRG
jgi:tetratricopeptide (TPR) repeat protein